MNTQTNETRQIHEEEIELNIRRIASAIIHKLWVIILMSVVGAVLSLLLTVFAMTPKYEASAMFYVNNSAISMGDVSLSSITSSDITASKNLVNSYIVILNTRESLNDVIDYSGVDRTYSELQRMISAASVDDTEIFEVVITSEDPQEAEKIASAIAYILPKRISSIIEGTSAKVVDSAVIPTSPSSPSYTGNTVLGFLLGFLLSVGAVVVWDLFDVTIREDEDVTKLCAHPILAAVPNMLTAGKGGYDYSYDRKAKGSGAGQNKKPVIMGDGMSFAAAEAYKLLRTKLQFSFAGDGDCRVIGISSALSGEGKSLTSINLAYSLSQLNKRVILIDADMRRPTVAENLKLPKGPGLSSLLTGQSSLKEVLQYCNMEKEERAFHVMVAGMNPPNPIELLSSGKMTAVLNALRNHYDYVILDLPPVCEVSDAMAVANVVDGMLLVVRQNYCNRAALAEAVRQFDFMAAKILGIVLNCADEHGGSYRRGYYKYNTRYGKAGKKSG